MSHNIKARLVAASFIARRATVATLPSAFCEGLLCNRCMPELTRFSRWPPAPRSRPSSLWVEVSNPEMRLPNSALSTIRVYAGRPDAKLV